MVTDKKFTKGEWEIFHESDGTPHIACNCEIISTINCGSYDGGKTYKPTEEENANAKLIAASPDLLEACERALETLENENIFGQARLLLALAIKKATE